MGVHCKSMLLQLPGTVRALQKQKIGRKLNHLRKTKPRHKVNSFVFGRRRKQPRPMTGETRHNKTGEVLKQEPRRALQKEHVGNTGCNLRDWGKLQCGQELPACSKEGLSRKPLPQLDGGEEGVEEEATPSRCEKGIWCGSCWSLQGMFSSTVTTGAQDGLSRWPRGPRPWLQIQGDGLWLWLRQKWQAEVLETFVSKVCAICAVINHNHGPITSNVINIKYHRQRTPGPHTTGFLWDTGTLWSVVTKPGFKFRILSPKLIVIIFCIIQLLAFSCFFSFFKKSKYLMKYAFLRSWRLYIKKFGV